MSMKTVASIFTIGVLCCVPVNAQESRGTITGRVVDTSGAVVVGGEVRAVSKETAAISTARTNDAGSYTAKNIATRYSEPRQCSPFSNCSNRIGEFCARER